MSQTEPRQNLRNSAQKAEEAQALPTISSDELFRGAREVKLFHGSEEYRLRITKNQKLILTK
ncbi:MAG: hemin uptake protein HemP [Planctomycetota bacterium]